MNNNPTTTTTTSPPPRSNVRLLKRRLWKTGKVTGEKKDKCYSVAKKFKSSFAGKHLFLRNLAYLGISGIKDVCSFIEIRLPLSLRFVKMHLYVFFPVVMALSSYFSLNSQTEYELCKNSSTW